ncbi:MAG: UDP-N-acetylmuramoyl-L-alanyl-D-glutamate--2,6-diaminopimelate ligase [Magnetococcales bacterium]|nr:UDP-N-acetylmuramoyl-L-alanyl-D-glutamate--2,6-diaminopimelate ligase [Magnetococcales bacterium]
MSQTVRFKASQLHARTNLEGLVFSGADSTLSALTADSRQVQPGTLFAALSGSQQDGNRFIPQAIEAGASALLFATPPSFPLPETLAQFSHPQPRLALAHLAETFYDHPGTKLKLAAITGTNGKTSVAAMMESILMVAKERVGIIGTTGIRWPDHQQNNPLTTPDSISLQACLAQMVEADCRFAVLEVSSHALSQHRVEGLPFHVALFTNLSRDHLDYHGCQESYFRAKASLFLHNPPPFAVINLDDSHGITLFEECPESTEKIGFSLQGGGAERARGYPILTAKEVTLSQNSSQFQLVTPAGSLPICLPVAGRFNVANALAAAGGAWALGLDCETIAAGLAHFRPHPGRMNSLDLGQPFGVIIDFAHTPDGLENLIKAARETLTNGRILTVFGCGGDRDPGKRQQMGEISGRLSDRTFITDDNPRHEEPAAIRAAIVQGCHLSAPASQTEQVTPREEAILQALTQARAGDMVLIAGKGHETHQIIADEKRPFDDRQVAIQALNQLGYSG